ncbi:hypothetical protein ABPG74_000419 [Tetrahymena malaccensis]
MKDDLHLSDYKQPLLEFDVQNKDEQNFKCNQVNFTLPWNVQEEGVIRMIESFKVSQIKMIVFYFLNFLSLGVVYLFTRWQVTLRVKLQMEPCMPEQADFLLITSDDETQSLEKIMIQQMGFNGINSIQTYKTFTYRLYKFYFHENKFNPIQIDLTRLQNKQILDLYGKGLKDQNTFSQQVSIFGLNNTEIPQKPTIKILIYEVLSPFYMFQLFSFLLWMVLPYYFYASIILITSVVSAIVTLSEAKSNYKKLQEMSYFETPVFSYRYLPDKIKIENGELKLCEDIIKDRKQISSLHLVPGDVIEIQDGQTIPCDIILLNGQCIMNESMLTGESIPIVKQSLPYNENRYDYLHDGKQSTLFAGTKCIETRTHLKGKIPVVGLVSQTSFNTLKGQLVRSILYPKQNSFSFYTDSMRFIAVMATMSLFGFFVSLPDWIEGINEGFVTYTEMFLECLDLVTVTVPPALPTCLSIGISFAMSRLKRQQIFCISPPKVNICGKVTVMCFDKTGTLTEEGLDMYGVRSIRYADGRKVKFNQLTENIQVMGVQKSQIQSLNQNQKTQLYGNKNPFIYLEDPEMVFKECMASCHSITRVNNQIIGDPLEIKMFEATKWILLEENIPQNYEFKMQALVKDTEGLSQLAIIKRFEFSSKLQRMSSIVKKISNSQQFYRLHVKGSPEKIHELSNPETIPDNYHEVLDFYARKGFRIISFAIKNLYMGIDDIQKCERDQIENQLTFVGMLIMENKLKPETKGIINDLNNANIRTIMVTGDNSLTAISVARQCLIVNNQTRVYFGDIDDENHHESEIVWKDFEHSDKHLDEENLQPIDGVADYKEDGIQEIQEEKMLFDILESNNEQFLHQQPLKSNKTMKEQIDMIRKSIQSNTDNSSSHFIRQNSANQKHLESNFKDKFQKYEETQIQYPWLNDDHFVLAVTGRAFSKIISESKQSHAKQSLAETMLQKTQIYARMRPEEKTLLLQSLQELPTKPVCGMCGDGANDCGALKTADVGISLSEAEASIAAPFTSKVQNISCVVHLLKEGRAALVTSFSCFKFMALYSAIQFFTTTLLYTVQSIPSDTQLLYWDVAVILPLAFFMGLTDSCDNLSKQVPGSSLVSFQVLSSVIGQTILNGAFQTYMFLHLKKQSWYLSVKDAHNYLGDLEDLDERKNCYESTTLFLFSSYQYIATCLAFSIGKPFKKPFYTNTWFTASVIVIFFFSLYVHLFSGPFLQEFLNIFLAVQREDEEKPLTTMPKSWLLFILFAAGVNFICCFIYEHVIVKLLCFVYFKCKLIYLNK